MLGKDSDRITGRTLGGPHETLTVGGMGILKAGKSRTGIDYGICTEQSVDPWRVKSVGVLGLSIPEGCTGYGDGSLIPCGLSRTPSSLKGWAKLGFPWAKRRVRDE